MTSGWTDERMDDLKHQADELGRRMDDGFAGLRTELREHRREMDARFAKFEERLDQRFEKIDERFENVGARFEKIDERFEKVDARFEKVDESILRTQEMVIGLRGNLTRVSIAFVAALMSLVAAQAGLILTQI